MHTCHGGVYSGTWCGKPVACIGDVPPYTEIHVSNDRMFCSHEHAVSHDNHGVVVYMTYTLLFDDRRTDDDTVYPHATHHVVCQCGCTVLTLKHILESVYNTTATMHTISHQGVVLPDSYNITSDLCVDVCVPFVC